MFVFSAQINVAVYVHARGGRGFSHSRTSFILFYFHFVSICNLRATQTHRLTQAVVFTTTTTKKLQDAPRIALFPGGQLFVSVNKQLFLCYLEWQRTTC